MSVMLNDSRDTNAPSMARAEHGLTFLQPVTRELVHRSSIGEVFVTDGVRTGESEVSVAAQWPRDHALYHPDENGMSDPLLLAETLRQAHFYAAHKCFGVPLGSRFVGQDVSFRITDPTLLRIGEEPLAVVLHGNWTEERRSGRPAGARLDATLVIDGRVCGDGHTRGLMLDDRRYRLVRGRPSEGGPRPPGALAAEVAWPGRVGRLRWKDCVLERDRSDEEWRLRVDVGHAVLFDHPTDHIPLMVLLEGFRQLGHLTVHDDPPGSPDDPAYALTGLSLDCTAFGELGEPVGLTIEDRSPASTPKGRRVLTVAAHQGGTPLARADMTWTCVGRRTRRLHPTFQRAVTVPS